jgi:carbonic anhydrase
VAISDDVRRANAEYAAQHYRGGLPLAPAKHLAVLTCMDARIVPIPAFGLDLGDAHVIRNAGGLATDDALRSLAISHRLGGTREAIVVGHTDCALESGSEELRGFHSFPDVFEAVRESVRRIEASPLLPEGYRATGFVFDVATGLLQPV